MSKERPDYYAVLGVTPRAGPEELKAAYRRLAIELHPDRHGKDDAAGLRFDALLQAWSVLGDENNRRLYDAGRAVPGVKAREGSSVTEAFGRIVDKVFGVRAKRPVPGRDIRYTLHLTFAEAALGTRRALVLPSDRDCSVCAARGFAPGTVPELCPRCQGCGDVQVRRTLRTVVEECPDCAGRGYLVTTPCPACDGSGREEVQASVDIVVPAGVKTGERLLIREAGRPGRHGGPAGRCFVHLEVTDDPILTLREDTTDIEMVRPIAVFDAILGARVTVPTVEGPRVIKIEPGTPPGTVLRMAGFGAADRDSGARGDQLVTIAVELPSELSEVAQRDLRALVARVDRGAFPATMAFERQQEQAPSDER